MIGWVLIKLCEMFAESIIGEWVKRQFKKIKQKK